MPARTCPKCDQPVPADRRVDARWCSDRCKGRAEAEVDRLQRHLRRWEDWQAMAPILGTPKKMVGQLQQLIEQAETRLQVLRGD